ncbi:MAG: TlpA disulfide reductase family protein [Candidatus Deferrimicrobiaceae bacterium]
MKKPFLALAGMLVLGFTVALVLHLNTDRERQTDGEVTRGRPLPLKGSVAPAFSLRDVNGNIVLSSHFLGKPTVINFFATWCPPCVEEIPGFVDVYNKYKDRGFELVGISFDTDPREKLPAFVKTHRIEYRILLGDLDTARAYGGVSYLPTTIFIGKDGRIRNIHVGYLDRNAFDSEVRKLL